MKIFNFILALLFALFAIVQYNDPDPLRWIVLYGFVAFISLMAGFGRYYPWMNWLGIIICVIWSATLFPSIRELVGEHNTSDLIESMQATKPYIEGSRESLGLLLSAIILVFHLYRHKRILQRKP